MRGERTVSCVLPGKEARFRYREWGQKRAINYEKQTYAK